MAKVKTNYLIWVVVAGILGVVLFFMLKANKTAENGDNVANNDQGEQTIDTSSWKTYENEEYGFSFKYPEDWEIKENGNKIEAWSEEEDGMGVLKLPNLEIIVEENENNLEINEWIKRRNEINYLLNYDDRAEFVLAEGTRGYKILEEGNPDHYGYYFVNSLNAYNINSLIGLQHEEVIKSLVIN